MDALDVFGAGAEVGRVVDFVLEELFREGKLVERFEGVFSGKRWGRRQGGQEGEMEGMVETYNAGDFIADEFGRLVDVVAAQEEVALEGSREDGEHGVASGFHTLITGDVSPHLDRIRKHRILGATFLVLAIRTLKQAFRPRMPMVPVEHPREREIRIFATRVRCIADQHVHPIFVWVEPAGFQVCNDRGGVDEVPVVEMMVVVQRIPKIEDGIAGRIGARRDDAAPDGIVYQWVNLTVCHEKCKSAFELVEALEREVRHV